MLTDLYGRKPTRAALWTKRRAGLALLDRLRAKVPELSGGLLDLDELAPRVLMFEQGRVVMPEDEHDLMKAAMADEVRDASRLETVSAFHMVRKGAFHPKYRIPATPGNPRGWNWGSLLMPELDLTRTRSTTTGRRGTAYVFDEEGPAPWTEGRSADYQPYLYCAPADKQSVTVRGIGGFQETMPFEVFVELVNFDPQRPTVMGPNDAFLLVMPGINLWNTYLQDELVRRYGHDTWAATGPTRWGRREDNLRYQLELDNDNRTGVAPRSRWLVRDRETLAAAAALPGGDLVWDRDIMALPISGRDYRGRSHRMTGFVSMEFSKAMSAWSVTLWATNLHKIEDFYFTRPRRSKPLAGPFQVPWRGRPVISVDLHGLPGRCAFNTPSGQVAVRVGESGRRIAHQLALTGAPLDVRFVLVNCYGAAPGGRDATLPSWFASGAQMGVSNVLADRDRSTLREVANRSERSGFAVRDTFGSRTELIPGSNPPAHRHSIMMYTDERGEGALKWYVQHPEPKGAALDPWVSAAGLTPRPGASEQERSEARERTLALARVLVHWMDGDVVKASDFPQLLRGMGQLERMRAADTSLDLPGGREFTIELSGALLDAYASRLRAQGRAVPSDVPAFLRDFLSEVNRAWQAQPKIPLTRFAPVRFLSNALSFLATPEGGSQARLILSYPASQAMEESDWSRAVWTVIKYRQHKAKLTEAGWAELAGFVLDRPAAQAATDPEASTVVLKAIAAGRNHLRRAELASFRLELKGMLSSSRVLGTSNAAWGRQFHDVLRPRGQSFDPHWLTRLRRNADGTFEACGREVAPWSGDTGPAFVYDVPVHWLHRIEALADLAYRDPRVRASMWRGPLILTLPAGPMPAGSRPVGGGLLGAFAGSTARTTYASTNGMVLWPDPVTGVFTLAVVPLPGQTEAPENSIRKADPDLGDGPAHLEPMGLPALRRSRRRTRHLRHPPPRHPLPEPGPSRRRAPPSRTTTLPAPAFDGDEAPLPPPRSFRRSPYPRPAFPRRRTSPRRTRSTRRGARTRGRWQTCGRRSPPPRRTRGPVPPPLPSGRGALDPGRRGPRGVGGRRVPAVEPGRPGAGPDRGPHGAGRRRRLRRRRLRSGL
ncbi:lonely Cys domain-containing protein [Streptomyces lydicus]|nr:lonely Cys domain-containing protein [Streptomyces lydicus]